MNDLPEDYEINEADIDKMIRYMQLERPEDTITPEMAIERLEQMHQNFHELAHTNPGLLEKWYEAVKPADEETTESDRST